MNILSRVRSAWGAFLGRDPTFSYGQGSYIRPDRPRFSSGNERSTVTSIYNRFALDTASYAIQHVKLDKNDRYLETIDSDFNRCLNLSANIDQTGRALIQDIVISMMDEGVVAVVPIEVDRDPIENESFKIYSLRTAKIIQWYPRAVQVRLYDDRDGQEKDITLPKSSVAIIENPWYAVVNEPNSTMQRLIHKLGLLDFLDDQNSSGKMDLIIQLPYVIKNDLKKAEAEKRRKDIEMQLVGSKYGIAYIDGTERITQLNRAVDNNLFSQIESLTSTLYSQLGINQAILDGTADEATMLNYYNRTIEPILSAIADEFKRKFLTQTARSQGHSVKFFRDPFKLVPVSTIAELADKMTRNEIMTGNEIRQSVGLKPSKDPSADELRNKNLSEPKTNIENKQQIQSEDDREENKNQNE